MNRIKSFTNKIIEASPYFMVAIFIWIAFSFNVAFAQQSQPQHAYNVNLSRPSASFIPMAGVASNPNAYYRSQWLYLPGDFGTTVPSGQNISSIYFKIRRVQNVDLINFKVSLKQDTITTLDSTIWEIDLTTVRQDSAFLIRNMSVGDWIKIDLDNSFPYDPSKSLIVEIEHSNVIGGLFLESGGTPLNPTYTNEITQLYGQYQATAAAGIGTSYTFGFDLTDPRVPFDVGVAVIDSPRVYCKHGVYNVYATIKNYGTNQIDSVDVVWEVNGRAEGFLKYRGRLDTLNGNNFQEATIRLGAYYFGQISEIKVYTSKPNNQNDNNNSNDTIVRVVRPAFNGNYTVNKNLPATETNFTSLTALASSLNELGVCGPTIIDVAQDTYNEPFHLKNIQGTSPTNNLLIRGQDSSKTLVVHDGSLEQSTFALFETKHVRIQGMGFVYTGSSGRAVTFVSTSHDTLSNCAAWGSTSNPASDSYTVAFNGATSSNIAAAAHYNVVQNCRLIGSNYGIRVMGLNSYFSSNNGFYNNIIDSAAAGVSFSHQDSLDFIGNKVNANTFMANGGVTITNSSNVHVKQNYIYATSERGLELSSQIYYSSAERRNVISNNMVVGGKYSAVFLYGINAVDFWHNTVYGLTTTPGIQIGTPAAPISDYDFRNNIFASDNGFAFTQQTGAIADTSIYREFDYNIYHRYRGLDLFRMNGEQYLNLMGYQRDRPMYNVHSLQGDPHFAALSPIPDLHIVGSYPDERGDNSVGVTVDIDNEARPSVGATYVDIGADEFLPPPCPSPKVVIDSITKYTATAYFTPTTIGNTIEYVLVRCGTSRASGTVMTTTADSVFFGGLESEACYNLYVREICSPTSTSLWAGPYSFYPLIVPYYAITSVNKVDSLSGVADSLGLAAWLSGVVVGPNLHLGNGMSYTLIDMATNTQEGIHLYSDNRIGSRQISEGDSIKVSGVVQQVHGLIEFHIDSLIFLKRAAVPAPIVVDSLGESTESKLLEIKNFVLLDAPQTGTYEMRAYKDNDTISIRVHEKTDVSSNIANLGSAWSVGDTICQLMGVGGQYDTSSTAPYLGGYHITPLYYRDIVICRLPTAIDSKDEVLNNLIFYPNPTQGELIIESSGLENDNAVLIVRDVNGRLIIEESISNSSSAFKVQYNLEDYAKGLYFISITDGNKQINKKIILK